LGEPQYRGGGDVLCNSMDTVVGVYAETVFEKAIKAMRDEGKCGDERNRLL
jgi:hypothetical protein